MHRIRVVGSKHKYNLDKINNGINKHDAGSKFILKK